MSEIQNPPDKESEVLIIPMKRRQINFSEGRGTALSEFV
jgi:hypothetical protein